MSATRTSPYFEPAVGLAVRLDRPGDLDHNVRGWIVALRGRIACLEFPYDHPRRRWFACADLNDERILRTENFCLSATSEPLDELALELAALEALEEEAWRRSAAITK